MTIRFGLSLLLGAALAGCGPVGTAATCRFQIQCDRSKCFGVSNGCSELLPEARDQASCADWAGAEAGRLNGAVISATFAERDHC